MRVERVPGVLMVCACSWRLTALAGVVVALMCSGVVRASAATSGFGPSSFSFAVTGQDGLPDTQAGGHPYELTARIALNSELRIGPDGTFENTSVQDVRDLVIDLPPGLLVSVPASTQCMFAQLSSHIGRGVGGCPSETIVGHIHTEPKGGESLDGPIYNMVPEGGFPAELAYVDVTGGTHALYASIVPSAAGYVLRVSAPELPQVALTALAVTLFGDPASKDAGQACGTGSEPKEVSCREGLENSQVPLLTDPSDCSGQPLSMVVHMDSWQDPGGYNADGMPDLGDPAWVSASAQSPPVTGCNLLRFTPELGVRPTTNMADSPSGLELELRSPPSGAVEANATPALRTAVVTLPEGMTVDPSAGDGLQVCNESQIGWVGPGGGGSIQFFTAAPPECPEGSKVGSLELTTPLFAGTLTGVVYLAPQDENPFGSVLAVYAVVDDPLTGVVLKIAGELRADPRTGRLTVVLAENPQLPFSDLKLHFFGGPRALLATPDNCGTYTTSSVLEPWSALESDPTHPDATPFDSFAIDSGCVSGLHPSFTGGSLNLQAGAYTPFVASFSRQDSDQELAGWSVSLPPGLLAGVGGVPLCGEARANAGTCPEASRVATVLAGAGPGPNPLFVAGKAYLTGPYNGGPYGLSLVVPVIAGPFNFGTVVVRASLRLDPHTAQVTVVSDPFPSILDVTGANGQISGIPIRLRRVDVSFDRPGFIFNPTNCAKLSLNGSIASAGGASAAVSSPFQVTDCKGLKFKPKFEVSTSGKTSRSMGASLRVKLSYPSAPFGRSEIGQQANLASVKVDLPKQLVSRLATLGGACLASVFDQNPAACPATSRVGTASVTTPVLRVATSRQGRQPPGRDANLSGPAYFVSHGGKKFPELIVVLQGDGVTVDLRGETFIDKAGITSSTFRTIPDVPVETFELNLPEGSGSALAANGKLCQTGRTVTVSKRVRVRVHGHVRTVTRRVKKKVGGLVMPTALTAQNGAVIHQNTPISVTGCPPARAKKVVKHKGSPMEDLLSRIRRDVRALGGVPWRGGGARSAGYGAQGAGRRCRAAGRGSGAARCL